MDEIVAERERKLAELESSGINPFPYSFSDRESISDVVREGEALSDGEATERVVRIAGRIIARRGHGKIAFIDIREDSSSIQLLFKANQASNYSMIENIDIGDFIGIEGTLIKSQRGETTILINDWTLLTKTLRPLPDKFHGLKDEELRSRRRELDLLANQETLNTFKVRGRVTSAIRRFLEDRDFLEVETPALQPVYGGALARPFKTLHNSLNQEMYLRIASELYLKRCLVGGIDRVFEIGKNFRNEGLSRKHNPEFTMVEYYQAYADYNDIADGFEELIRSVSQYAIGTAKIEINGQEIDFNQPWRRITFRDAVIDKTGIDIFADNSREQMASFLGEEMSWADMADKIFSNQVEPSLIEPTFIFDYPVEMSPFAKVHRDDPRLVERFEAFVGGQEIANAFSELNDPREQKKRFLDQEKSDEAQPYDEDFILALEHGMPPTGGLGLGIDRLVMLLTGKKNLREVILFPAMKNV